MKNIYFFSLSMLALFFLTQCCTSKEQIQNKPDLKKISSPNSPLPFGTADVTATIVKFVNENSKNIGILKVDSVHSYGPSTKPIGIGSKMNIEFSNNLFKRNENVSLEMLKKDSKTRLLIKYIDAGVKINNRNMWQIINIKSIN